MLILIPYWPAEIYNQAIFIIFSENISIKKLLKVTLRNYFRLIKAQIAAVYLNRKLNFKEVCYQIQEQENLGVYRFQFSS